MFVTHFLGGPPDEAGKECLCDDRIYRGRVALPTPPRHCILNAFRLDDKAVTPQTKRANDNPADTIDDDFGGHQPVRQPDHEACSLGAGRVVGFAEARPEQATERRLPAAMCQ